MIPAPLPLPETFSKIVNGNSVKERQLFPLNLCNVSKTSLFWLKNKIVVASQTTYSQDHSPCDFSWFPRMNQDLNCHRRELHACTTGWYAAITLTASIPDEYSFVVLAKHRTTPWWWFLREPKHVGASVIVFKIVLTFYNFIIVCISWNNNKVFWYYLCMVQTEDWFCLVRRAINLAVRHQIKRQ